MYCDISLLQHFKPCCQYNIYHYFDRLLKQKVQMTLTVMKVKMLMSLFTKFRLLFVVCCFEKGF